VTERGLYVDDGNVLPTLRALMGELSAMADAPQPKAIDCKPLTRLDYRTLQAMLALKIAYQDQVDFEGLEHLEPALIRYGLKPSFFKAKQGQA
jgi:hypothetical protein